MPVRGREASAGFPPGPIAGGGCIIRREMTFSVTASLSGLTLGRLAEEVRVSRCRLIVVSSFFCL